MSNSQRLRAHGRAAVLYLVLYPVGIVLTVLVAFKAGELASWLGLQ